MNNYSEVAAKIAADYLERVKERLRGVPAREQSEFLMEIESHLYEAYQQTPGEDEVARMLAVVRKFGEPSDVVSERLPGRMLRSGRARKLPLYILGGLLIAFFGVPLGFTGVGVLIGLLSSLAGLMLAYYAVAGSALLTGGLFLILGLARIGDPALWDRLVALGFIQMNGQFGEFFAQLPISVQALAMLLLAGVFVATGGVMLWLGKYMLRGFRFLCGLIFDWTRRFSQTVRQKLRNRREQDAAMPFTRPAASQTRL